MTLVLVASSCCSMYSSAASICHCDSSIRLLFHLVFHANNVHLYLQGEQCLEQLSQLTQHAASIHFNLHVKYCNFLDCVVKERQFHHLVMLWQLVGLALPLDFTITLMSRLYYFVYFWRANWAILKSSHHGARLI